MVETVLGVLKGCSILSLGSKGDLAKLFFVTFALRGLLLRASAFIDVGVDPGILRFKVAAIVRFIVGLIVGLIVALIAGLIVGLIVGLILRLIVGFTVGFLTRLDNASLSSESVLFLGIALVGFPSSSSKVAGFLSFPTSINVG
jgi:hypothetical protein